MSSIYSVASSRSTKFSEVEKFIEQYIKMPVFLIFYSLVKENSIGGKFFIFSTIMEFIQLVLFCFRDAYNWGGLKVSFDFDDTMMSYKTYKIIFWIIAGFMFALLLNTIYIGYTLAKGAIKSVFLLRLLRWLSSLYLSVLYIPFLFFLLGGIACDYSVSPATLIFFREQTCWGGNEAISIIGILLVCVYAIFALFLSLNFYENDPTVPNACSKQQSRFEFLSICAKLVLVIAMVFFIRDRIVFLIVSPIIAFFLLGLSIIGLPYYKHRYNLMRSGAYAGVLWVNIIMVVSYVIDNSSSIALLIVATAGIPIFGAVGAFLAHIRFKYLCDPSLVDGYISSEEMESLPANKPKKKSVNFEPRTNHLIKNKLYGRLRFPFDVEIAARFVLEGTPNAALIEKAKTVYQTGLSKFPKSHIVLQAYASFMLTTVGDWQLGYVVLEKLRKMKIHWDTQFFVYRYDKDRERKSESGNDKISDFVDFMEYKKIQHEARRNHTTALVSMRKFWHYLLAPKVDVAQLSALSTKIAVSEKKCAELYSKLLLTHPKNVRVLRDFAKFLDEVVQDEGAAKEMRKKADKYEKEEMESQTASHRSGNNLIVSEVETTTSEPEGSDFHSESSFNRDDTTISSASSGIRSRLSHAKLDKNNSLKKLGWLMLATTAFVLIVGFVELGVLNNMLRDYEYAVKTQISAGGTAQAAMRVSTRVADAYTVGLQSRMAGQAVSFSWTGSYATLSFTLRMTITALRNNVKALYYGTSDPSTFGSKRFVDLKGQDGYKVNSTFVGTTELRYEDFDHVLTNKKDTDKIFNNPIYNQTLYIERNVGITDVREYKNSSLWGMCNRFNNMATEVISLQIEDFYNSSKLQETSGALSYSLENSQELSIGMNDLINYYVKSIDNALHTLELTCMIIFVVATCLLLLASVAIFRPIVKEIFANKVRTFTMFTLIPPQVVKVMTKRRIGDLNKADTSDDEEEEEEAEERETEVKSLTASVSVGIKESGEIIFKKERQNRMETIDEHKVLLPNSYDGDDEEKTNISEESDKNNKKQNNLNNSSTIVEIIGEEEEKEEKERMIQNTTTTTTTMNSARRRMSQIMSMIPVPWNKQKYNKIGEEESEEDEKVVKNIKRQKEKKDKRKSRLDVSSLQAVTRKMHFSYLFAIACIIAALLVAFFIIRHSIQVLSNISSDIESQDYRSIAMNAVAMDFSVLTIYRYGGIPSKKFIEHARTDLGTLWDIYNNVPAKSYQLDLMFSNDCFSIDSSKCPSSSTPYYNDYNKGFDFALFQYLILGETLLQDYIDGNVTLSVNNPNYKQLRTMIEVLLDGSERLTYMVYKRSLHKIDETKRTIAIVVGVESVLFIFIYLVLFRPFVKQLRTEIEHTFSLIRMIPRKLLVDVPEIQLFIQDTLDQSEN